MLKGKFYSKDTGGKHKQGKHYNQLDVKKRGYLKRRNMKLALDVSPKDLAYNYGFKKKCLCLKHFLIILII
jgi:hypothetical protein